MRKFLQKYYLAIVVILVAITAGILLTMGRIPICECGYIQIWHNGANDSGNSQHLFDWYSLSHILHGILIYFAIFLLDRRKKLSIKEKLILAVFFESGWEILENSPFIIDRYRQATISLNYYGDSVINSVGDIISMAIGFILAAKNKTWVSVIIFVTIELLLLIAIKDNLTINIIMLIYPLESIKLWQNAGNALIK